MAMNANVDAGKVVVGLAPVTPSSSTPDYVSLKNFNKCRIVIAGKNATTVTGSAITLKQASDVSATGEKALSFTNVKANTDVGAGDTLTDTAVSSNTFTCTNTNSKDFLYVIDVKAADLDVANGFDCIRAGTANATNQTLSVTYHLMEPRYASADAVAAITD